jgi:heme/copper-type cytochrome/quinol oxidase subunit 3
VSDQALPRPIEETLPHHASGPRAFGWWGIVWLIATEATLFAMLLASYFYIRFRSGPVWPPDGIEEPDLALPIVMTIILLSSSIPVHIAERGVKKGNDKRLRYGLAAGWVLGATFLALTWGVEWPEVLHEFGPTTNSYGSMFFTITGFHGAHVLGGLGFSLWAQVRAWKGAFGSERHSTIENFTLYWHFVDTVWVGVMLTLYISPHL